MDISLLDKYDASLPDETVLRVQKSYSRRVVLLCGDPVGNSSSVAGGVCARTYRKGVYGFASLPEYTDAAIGTVLARASENAAFLGSRAGKKDAPLPADFFRGSLSPRPFVPVPQGTIMDFARAIDGYIAEKYPSLASRTVACRSDCRDKLLTVGAGVCHQTMPRSYLIISLSAQAADGSGTVDVFEVLGGGEGYFTDYYTEPSDWFGRIDAIYEELMKKAEGVFPDAGMCDCVIDSELAGMLAHEAVGHTTEADLVLAGSVAAGRLGQQVASEKISLTDFAYEAFGEKAPLPVYVDDEGTAASDVPIITNGILTGYMTSRETSTHFDGMPVRGNARAFAYSDEPLVRMRNTCIHPGTDKLEDMIASIDKGYYLLDSGNGQADTTGEFMFGITRGYEIVGGKLGRALRDTTISGVAFDMLKTVDMVGDTVAWSSSGYCGKKQPMPVSMGGPAIKGRVNIGGR
ncbi:MAG: TldD/PmbA family protein [Clostridia bacterium]|nr:TldD/PmbA family protein [Clostridia bacterium]